MSITVVFDRSGFYHPAYGRMGLGKNSGVPYKLPDAFKGKGMLPATAKILKGGDELEKALDEAEVTKPLTPKIVDETQYEQAMRAAPAEPTGDMSVRRRKLDED